MINKNELLFTVDEDNNPISPKPRHEAHSKGYWHRVAHVWVVNADKHVLCQKRSLLKDSAPGMWEPFFGGHLAPGTDYPVGAKLELKEELGIDLEDKNLKFWKIYKSDKGKEFQGVFVYIWDGDVNSINFEEEEIDQIRWFDFEIVKSYVLDKKENNWSKMGYQEELLEFIKGL